MAPPNNINIFYFYLMSLFCSFSITATSSWIAHIPLQWWPLLIPLMFVLVILSISSSGVLQLNSGTGYVITENVPIDPGLDPNHNPTEVTSPSFEHPTAGYSTNGNAGYEDDRGALITMPRTNEIEIEIEEIEIEEIFEEDTEHREKHEEIASGSASLEDECKRNRITLQMLLLAQAKFERKQEAYIHKKRRKIKRVGALVPSFFRCFSIG